jgi:hypothetical protein
VSRLFFERVVLLAWASMKSCVKKEGSAPPPKDGGRNPTVDFKRSNAAHVSTTDPEARLYKKSEGDQAQRCFMGHALMENRSGLVVDVEVTHATGTAERDAAKIMMGRTVEKPGATLGRIRLTTCRSSCTLSGTSGSRRMSPGRTKAPPSMAAPPDIPATEPA